MKRIAVVLVTLSAAFAAPRAQAESIFRTARDVRCKTALCFGSATDPTEFAFEPLLELPVGGTFALSTHPEQSALAQWINSHALSIQFNAGLRFWFLSDWMSVSVYYDQPIANGSNTVHVSGSSYDYPTSNIRRPYPSFSLGLFQDVLWIGFDYQQLDNGDTVANSDINFPLNYPVSRAWSMTIGLAVATSSRSAIGAIAALRDQRKGGGVPTDTNPTPTDGADSAGPTASSSTSSAEPLSSGAASSHATPQSAPGTRTSTPSSTGTTSTPPPSIAPPAEMNAGPKAPTAPPYGKGPTTTAPAPATWGGSGN